MRWWRNEKNKENKVVAKELVAWRKKKVASAVKSTNINNMQNEKGKKQSSMGQGNSGWSSQK